MPWLRRDDAFLPVRSVRPGWRPPPRRRRCRARWARARRPVLRRCSDRPTGSPACRSPGKRGARLLLCRSRSGDPGADHRRAPRPLAGTSRDRQRFLRSARRDRAGLGPRRQDFGARPVLGLNRALRPEPGGGGGAGADDGRARCRPAGDVGGLRRDDQPRADLQPQQPYRHAGRCRGDAGLCRADGAAGHAAGGRGV